MMTVSQDANAGEFCLPVSDCGQGGIGPVGLRFNLAVLRYSWRKLLKLRLF